MGSSVLDTIRNALFGSPPQSDFEPSREGVFSAFQQLVSQVEGLVIGIESYSTAASLPAVTGADNGTMARVFADATAANNTFWIVKAGVWVKDVDLSNALVGLAQEWAENPEDDAISGFPGHYSAMHWALKAAENSVQGKYIYGNRGPGNTNDAFVITTEGMVAFSAYDTSQLYVFNATGPNTDTTPTLNINSIGVKPLRLADGSEVPAGTYGAGTHLAVRYDAASGEMRIIFMSPVVQPIAGAYLIFTDVSGSTNSFVGTLTPQPLSDPTTVIFTHKVTSLQAEGGVSYRIAQIVDEPRQLKTVDGSQIAQGTWAVGDTLLVRYIAAGNYELITVFSHFTESAGDDYDDRRAFYTSRNIQIAAFK